MSIYEKKGQQQTDQEPYEFEHTGTNEMEQQLL